MKKTASTATPRPSTLRRYRRSCTIVLIASVAVLVLSLLTLTKPRPQVPLPSAASAPADDANPGRRPLVVGVAIVSLVTAGISLAGLLVLWGIGKRDRRASDPTSNREGS